MADTRPPTDTVTAVLDIIAGFYGDPAMARLPAQVGSSRPLFKVLLAMIPRIRQSQSLLTALCACAVFFYPRAWFSGRPRGIYGVSLTVNNTRSLARLTPECRACDPDFKLNSHRLTMRSRAKMLRACPEIARHIRQFQSPEAFVIFNQVLALVCLHAFHQDLQTSRPRLVIAANDHSPPTVALFCAAHALRIATVYVQHGPVTAHFPPLYTDLAILFSQDAADSYQSAATQAKIHTQTDVLFLPMTETPIKPVAPVIPPLRVCLALSRFVDMQQVRTIIETLRDSGQVSKICIARHPRCTETFRGLPSNITLLAPGTSAESLSETVDLCLVGNSGVALSFLRAGCPTYYVPPADLSLDDYYGFCQAGILPRFEAASLQTPETLAIPFQADWYKRMGRFDPGYFNEPSHFRTKITEHLMHLADRKTNEGSLKKKILVQDSTKGA